MASITSLMNSNYNTSSIYGNRNVLSGLASGMDTETMIENAVSGIKTKIERLLQQRTKIEWQQEAYRSIIDKAVNFSTKYTSYSSKTNLLSSSFFTNAVNTTVNGTYANKITASGKTSSDIKINAVKQLATAASYTVSGAETAFGDATGAITGKDFDITEKLNVSNVSGTLTFQYGGSNGASFEISFDELEDINEMEGSNSAEKLANAINKKLSEVTYSYTKNGFQETTTADKAIKAVANADGRIVFEENELKNGNSITISSATGKIKEAFDLDGSDNKVIAAGNFNLTTPMAAFSYLTDKELSVNFNGTTKKISLNEIIKDASFQNADDKNARFQELLQEKLDNSFGKDKNGTSKVSVDYAGGKLSFSANGEGDTLSLSGSAVKGLGFESGDANYINTSKKLSDVLGDDIFSDKNKLAAVGSVKQSSSGKYSVDSAGNRVSKGDDGKYYRVNSDGEFLYNFEVNGANINVTKDTTLESLMNSINSNAEAGVKVSYSKLTNEFKFTATETGANSKIEFGGLAKEMFAAHGRSGSDSFAEAYGVDMSNVPEGGKKSLYIHIGNKISTTIDIPKNCTMEEAAQIITKEAGLGWYEASYDELSGQIMITKRGGGEQVDYVLSEDLKGEWEVEPKFNSSYTKGQDAIMDVEINGKQFEDFTRSSNTFDIDGLKVTAKGTFNVDGKNEGKDGEDYEPITFTTTTDSDKIIDAIREFVNDYNEMATELKSAYSTMPAQQSNGSRYEPLTASQEEGMTESELKAYEEKAKQGILFGDSTLSSMYSKLLSAITPGGIDGQTLREIGIGTSYDNGMTTLSLDEDKLRAALESDPDKVKNAFAKTKEGGSSSDGLMQTLQNTLNTYVKTTGEPKGVLIQRAGSVKAYTSLNNNSLKTQMDNLDKQIERWQTKMSTQIDRYTTQFSRLEQLIAQMNSQASAFAGLMGGDTGY